MDPSLISMNGSIVDDVLGQIQQVHGIVSDARGVVQTTATNNADHSGGTVQTAHTEHIAHHLNKLDSHLTKLTGAHQQLSSFRDDTILTDNLAASQYQHGHPGMMA